MGFAIIVDETAAYGFRLHGETHPPDHLYPTVDSQLRRNFSPAELAALDGQHIGYSTDDGLVNIHTEYQRTTPNPRKSPDAASTQNKK